MGTKVEVERLMKPAEAAELLAISQATLRRLVWAGRIEAELIPGRGSSKILRFRPGALAAFQRANAQVVRPHEAPKAPASPPGRARLVDAGWDGDEHGRKRRGRT